MKKIDGRAAQKFAMAAGVLMTRVFSAPFPTNERRLAFACGPASPKATISMPGPMSKFDVLGLGFKPGREWKGPTEIFVEEMRDGQIRRWTNCSLYASTPTGPIYVLTEDPETVFSFDGHSLVITAGVPDDRAEGIARAKVLLREAARRVPADIEGQTMM